MTLPSPSMQLRENGQPFGSLEMGVCQITYATPLKEIFDSLPADLSDEDVNDPFTINYIHNVAAHVTLLMEPVEDDCTFLLIENIYRAMMSLIDVDNSADVSPSMSIYDITPQLVRAINHASYSADYDKLPATQWIVVIRIEDEKTMCFFMEYTPSTNHSVPTMSFLICKSEWYQTVFSKLGITYIPADSISSMDEPLMLK